MIELKEKMRAFKFRSILDMDLIEKYIIKGSDYNLKNENGRLELTVKDLTIKENDYILIKDTGFEVVEESTFNQNYVFKRDTSKALKILDEAK